MTDRKTREEEAPIASIRDASDIFSVRLSSGKLLGEATREDLEREIDYQSRKADWHGKVATWAKERAASLDSTKED